MDLILKDLSVEDLAELSALSHVREAKREQFDMLKEALNLKERKEVENRRKRIKEYERDFPDLVAASGDQVETELVKIIGKTAESIGQAEIEFISREVRGGYEDYLKDKRKSAELEEKK